MHLLIRKISPYSGRDLLLGAFRTRECAEVSKSEYLSTVVHGEADPWAQQAYHEVSDGDVLVLSDIQLIGVGEGLDRVFVVSSYSEGFGQVVRRFEAMAGSRSAALEYASKIEAANTEESFFPNVCRVDEVPVDRLTSASRGYGGYGRA